MSSYINLYKETLDMNVEVNRYTYIALASNKYAGYSFYNFMDNSQENYTIESMRKSGIRIYVNVSSVLNQGVCKYVHSIRL